MMSGFRIYLWAECAKLRRCRMLAVFVFGALLVVLLVLVQGGLNGSGVSYLAEPYWVLTGVQSLGSIFALPALVALLGGYLFCRERQEDVWKSLLVLPADTRWMTLAKLALTLAGSAGLYLLLFLAALCMEAVLHGGALAAGDLLSYLRMYATEGVLVFCAVLPVVAWVARRGRGYWLAVVLTEAFSVLVPLISGAGLPACLHPLVAAFTLAGYYPGGPAHCGLSAAVLAVCLAAGAALLSAQEKVD